MSAYGAPIAKFIPAIAVHVSGPGHCIPEPVIDRILTDIQI
jgi:hypothetical protein